MVSGGWVVTKDDIYIIYSFKTHRLSFFQRESLLTRPGQTLGLWRALICGGAKGASSWKKERDSELVGAGLGRVELSRWRDLAGLSVTNTVPTGFAFYPLLLAKP